MVWPFEAPFQAIDIRSKSQRKTFPFLFCYNPEDILPTTLRDLCLLLIMVSSGPDFEFVVLRWVNFVRSFRGVKQNFFMIRALNFVKLPRIIYLRANDI
jgi:hypothetical protein